MIYFDTFTKIAKECGRFGQINCCQKRAQSPINRPIWSHWLPVWRLTEVPQPVEDGEQGHDQEEEVPVPQ